MSDDPFDDPNWKALADSALRDMIPKLDESAVSMAVVPHGIQNRTDIQFCLQLGAMIMLDKPIIAIIEAGSKAPAKLVIVADELVEMGDGFKERMIAAIERVTGEKFTP